MKGRFKDITGQRFGKLVVVSYAGTIGRQRATWLCQCDCGKEKVIAGECLKRTKSPTRSCGCLRANDKHGWEIPAYKAYRSSYNDGDLSYEEFVELSQMPCFYCGDLPANCLVVHGQKFIYNGLDRIFQTRPHNKDNVIPACWICNDRKSNWDRREFLNWIRNIYNKTSEISL